MILYLTKLPLLKELIFHANTRNPFCKRSSYEFTSIQAVMSSVEFIQFTNSVPGAGRRHRDLISITSTVRTALVIHKQWNHEKVPQASLIECCIFFFNSIARFLKHYQSSIPVTWHESQLSECVFCRYQVFLCTASGDFLTRIPPATCRGWLSFHQAGVSRKL